ncbi:twin transmembrane helix small protein [Brevundimonas sp. M20]|jgi:hypothetical protein|uniref:twin transmembrane helix small protein n=1 Tax=Brevundimonas sp. M20 TaxID=2591463 RepID=UPI0011477617|nr:twin transmembrane helix small protein [Brevundimonas sp. M20]QDH72013.1 twin transmembrane helix small protein [Brevundimonas sp. M20]
MELFDILVFASVLAVAVTLALGLRQLYKDGPEARSRSNKLMRLRVALQALAVILLVTGLWWKSTHGA